MISTMALIYCVQGKLQQALELQMQAVQRTQHVVGAQNPRAISMNAPAKKSHSYLTAGLAAKLVVASQWINIQRPALRRSRNAKRKQGTYHNSLRTFA